jgi:hypothetical protein
MEEPKRVLDDWIKNYLDYTHETEPAYLYKLWIALSALSTVMQRKIKMPWGMGDTIHSNLYVILVGPPGARKGTAMRPGMHLLTKAGITFVSENITKEGLIGSMYGAKTAVASKDYIGEEVSLTVFAEEFVSFMNPKDLGLINNINRWFDCPEVFNYTTITRGTLELNNVWLSICGASTPEILRSQLSEEIIGSGFPSRVIYVFADDKLKLVSRPVLHRNTELEGKLINDLKHILALRGDMTWTKEFEDAYSDWYIHNDKNRPPHLAHASFDSYINRRPTHLRKISMICSISESSDLVLRETHFERALQILISTEQAMSSMYSTAGRLDTKEYLRQIMVLIAERKVVSYAELIDKYKNDLTTDDLDMLLKTLASMRYCKISLNSSNSRFVEFIPKEQRKTGAN